MDEIVYPHDHFVKSRLSRPDVAAGFLMSYMPAQLAAQLDLSAPVLLSESFIDENLRVHRSDLLYRVPLLGATQAVFIYLLLEHKSRPATRVALQLFRYLARIWEWLARQHTKGKLPLVFPLVIYHGAARWSVNRQFAALIKDGESADWVRYTPHFEYHLCRLSAGDEARISANVLKMFVMALIYGRDPNLSRKLVEILSLVRDLPEQSMIELLHTTLRYFSLVNDKVDGKQLREAAINATSPEIGEKVMATYGQQLFQEGRQEGKQEEALNLTLRLLERRFGVLEDKIVDGIRALSLKRLEALVDSVFDFKQTHDLTKWLAKNSR